MGAPAVRDDVVAASEDAVAAWERTVVQGLIMEVFVVTVEVTLAWEDFAARGA